MDTIISSIVSLGIFILIIGVLVFIHELGHFLTARMIDAKVEEFALGLGPILYKKRVGETVYMIKLFPIGGYVKILGETDDDGQENPRSLKNKTPLQKILVMIAGITMNLILATTLYYIVLSVNDYKVYLSNSFQNYKPYLATIKKEKITEGYVNYIGLTTDGNAKKSGLPQTGIIKSINNQEIEYSDEIITIVQSNKDKDISIVVCETGECLKEKIYKVRVSPEGRIGISISPNFITVLSYENNKLTSGFAHGYNIFKLSLLGMQDIFSQAKNSGDYTKAVNTVSGPVGIFLAIDKVKEFGFMAIVSLCADLSLVLGIMNLLPIPALDGGRILLTIPEIITGRSLNSKFEAILINISFILLLILMFVVFIKDIVFFQYIKDLLK